MVAKSTLISDTFRIIGEQSDSDEYGEDAVLDKMNEIVRVISTGYVTDVRDNNQVYAAGDLPYLLSKKFYTLIAPQPLTAAISSTSDVTVSFDTTSFPSTGYVLIEGDIVKYTGKTSTTITGVTGLDTTHLVGIDVYPLYSLPADYLYCYGIRETATNNRHNTISLYDQRHDNNAVTYGSIITNNSGVDLIYVDGYTPSDNKLMLQYYKDTTDMSDDADVCDIPDPRARRIVPSLVAGEMFWDNQEVEWADPALQAGYRRLKEFYKFYSRKSKSNITVIRPASLHRTINYGKTYQQRNRTRI